MRLLLSVFLGAGALLSAATAEIPADTLHDKIRGGLLGQILGDLNGLKHEMKYIAEPGSVERYVPDLPEGAWTDDDTDVEWVYLLEMQRSRTLMTPYPRIAELWKTHINRRIWCSHLYLRRLLDIGIEPPLTGSAHLNPWADFNLSGQFVSETWGLIAPGMPRTAARIAVHYTRVSIDGEPAQASQLFAGMIASAFLTGDMGRILDAGTASLDPASEMRRAVLDVRRWHREHPADWRATRALIQRNYSEHGGADVWECNGVKLNGAATIAALLYGNGDFTETVRHAFNFGWDADNNAATAGTILGIIKGHRWMMDQGWNIKDRFRNTSRDGMPEDETITSLGDRLIALADLAITQQGGPKAQANGRAVYRIRTEEPGNVEPLVTARRDMASLRAEWEGRVEAAVAGGSDPRDLARAAYLAISLDLAPALARKYPEKWAGAVLALSGYGQVARAMFWESGTPAGDRLRERALAAGMARPPKK